MQIHTSTDTQRYTHTGTTHGKHTWTHRHRKKHRHTQSHTRDRHTQAQTHIHIGHTQDTQTYTHRHRLYTYIDTCRHTSIQKDTDDTDTLRYIDIYTYKAHRHTKGHTDHIHVQDMQTAHLGTQTTQMEINTQKHMIQPT